MKIGYSVTQWAENILHNSNKYHPKYKMTKKKIKPQ